MTPPDRLGLGQPVGLFHHSTGQRRTGSLASTPMLSCSRNTQFVSFANSRLCLLREAAAIDMGSRGGPSGSGVLSGRHQRGTTYRDG